MKCACFKKDGSACGDDATARVHWPGRSIVMCAPHALQAWNIAEAMGFDLTFEPLPPAEPESHGERRTS
jgi:hypothetical protein